MQQEWEKEAVEVLIKRHGRTREEAVKILNETKKTFSDYNKVDGWDFVKMLKEHGK